MRLGVSCAYIIGSRGEWVGVIYTLSCLIKPSLVGCFEFFPFPVSCSHFPESPWHLPSEGGRAIVSMGTSIVEGEKNVFFYSVGCQNLKFFSFIFKISSLIVCMCFESIYSYQLFLAPPNFVYFFF